MISRSVRVCKSQQHLHTNHPVTRRITCRSFSYKNDHPNTSRIRVQFFRLSWMLPDQSRTNTGWESGKELANIGNIFQTDHILSLGSQMLPELQDSRMIDDQSSRIFQDKPRMNIGSHQITECLVGLRPGSRIHCVRTRHNITLTFQVCTFTSFSSQYVIMYTTQCQL